MLGVAGVGCLIKVVGIIGITVIEIVGYLQTPNVTCMFNNTINEVMSLNYYYGTTIIAGG